MEYSQLEQERRSRGWSRAYVEEHYRIPQDTLYDTERGIHEPRKDTRDALCRLYGKSAKELGIDKSDRMGVVTTNASTSHGEQPPMSDLVRREIFRNLGSRLTSLLDAWPKRNYQYAELQEGINRTILGYNTVVAEAPTYEQTRRQAVKDLILVPMQLTGGIALISSGKAPKADTDLLLKHCAAGIAACWYLRRGKDLTFVSDVVSTYLSLLQPLIYSSSENYRKASAELLAQSFRLKGSLSRSLDNAGKEEHYYLQALDYATRSGNDIEQAIANRILAADYFWHGQYEQGLPYAETAYGLMKSSQDMPRNVKSYVASGLSLCQSGTGHPQDAKISLQEALNLFDPSAPIPSMPYSEAILMAVSAAVYQYNENWEESIKLYEKSLTIPDISALGSIQTRINYAKTEVSRDDKPRDMGLCVTLVTEAITGATELDSERYKCEARECYNLLRIVWQRENAIKALGRDHFGLK